MVDIRGLDKAEVLRDLYNHAADKNNEPHITRSEAEKLMELCAFQNDDYLDETLYDQDYGEGAVQKIADAIRQRMEQAEMKPTQK